MNILYIISWDAASAPDCARQFFEALRLGLARGLHFPFNCPYEVGLARCPGLPGPDPKVAILAMSVTAPEIGSTESTLPQLRAWFARCGLVADGLAGSATIQSGPAQHLKLQSELGFSSEVIESFGTFVGEPEPVQEAAAPPILAAPSNMAAPSVVTAPPPVVAPYPVNPLPASTLPPYPLNPAGAAPSQFPTAPPYPVTPQSPLAPRYPAAPQQPAAPPSGSGFALTEGCSMALRVTLMVAGLLLLFAALCFGGFAIFGYIQPPDPGSDPIDPASFAVGLVVCTAPVILAAIVSFVLGLLLPRWLKRKAA